MEKKITLFLRRCLLLAGTLALVSSCQDYEPFSDQQIHDVAYTHEFERKFGKIDPNQNWDLFGQLARHIGPETRAIMAVEPTVTEGDKAPKEISIDDYDNYTLLLPEINRGNNDYGHSNLGQVTQDFLSTARDIWLYPVNWITTANDEIGIYWYVDEDDASDPSIITKMGKDDHLYYIKTKSIIANNKSNLEIVYELYEPDYLGRTELRKFIGDDYNRVGATASNGNPVSPLTYVYDGYRSNYRGDPDGNGNYQATEFRDNVSYNFFSKEEMESRGIKRQYLVAHPVHIHIPNEITQYGFYVHNCGAQYAWHNDKVARFSEWKLNSAESIEQNGTYHMSYTATFNINNLRPILESHGGEIPDDNNQYLCFEDWVYDNGSWGDADLNDVVYIAEGLDDATIKDNSAITENAILVCEDLKSFDFDFNDIVLGLTYKEEDAKTYEWIDDESELTLPNGTVLAPYWRVKKSDATSETLTITPMAAGGAYETTVYIGEISHGEIHALLKEASTPSDPKNHEIINAGATYDDNRGVRPIGPTDIMSFFEGSWDVGEGKTYPTHLSQIFAQGYIRLECYDGTAKQLVSSNQYAEGNAPQMMLLPHYFEWPREMVYISDAYSGFSEWVEDITKTNWILDTQDEDKITDRGEFVIDDPQQQEDNPVLIEGVQLPFHPGTFVYGTGDPSTGGFTFTNAYFVSLLGVDKLATADAKAELVVHYNPKTHGGFYIDDNDKHLLIDDPDGDDQPHNTTYTLSADRFNKAISSRGIWIMNQNNYQFGISMVELKIYGATDPENRHHLEVTPPSLVIDEIGTPDKQIVATSNTNAEIEFSSTDESIATVDQNGYVTAHAEGNCQIIVTAKATEGGHTANVARVNITVDRTPTYIATLGARENIGTVTENGVTRENVVHQAATLNEDMYTWRNGATITFYFHVASYANYEPQFFRILSPTGQVIAGELSENLLEWEGDKVLNIDRNQLQSCLVDGQYKFIIEYSDPPTDFISNVRVTKR